MKDKINLNKFKASFLTIAVLTVISLTGCMQENIHDDNRSSVVPSLEFKASLSDRPVASTRALTQDPQLVQANDFPGKFYIETYAPDFTPTEEKPNPQFATYIVPTSGSGGMLTYDGAINDPKKPNWCNIDDAHYFWSWTVPWEDPAVNEGGDNGDNPDQGDNTGGEDTGDDNNGDNNDPGNGGSRAVDDPADTPDPSDPTEKYEPSRNSIRVKLQNTYVDDFNFDDSTWNKGSWGNGKVLENLIGAHSGPYNFRQNGPEVPLQFRHLVSKISLRSLLFYTAAGNSLDNLKAEITFVNMPTEFVLYPHPTQKDVDDNRDNPYIRAGGPPIAVTDFKTANPKGGLTFAFTNPDKDIDMTPDEMTPYRDKFYICPEIDFSELEFYVKMYDEKYMTRGEYWGDFSTVVFEREPGTDYDNITDENGKRIDDSTILHAGEVMYFDLIVKESGGGGYRIYVQPWTERDNGPTKHFPHPGIYGKGDADDLITATNAEQWRTKFDLYGDGFTDGQTVPEDPQLPDHVGIFHMYGDVLRSGNTFPIGEGYVMDGMGYTMEFTPTNETTTVTIGNMVDIYLKLGQYTIYIDSDGVIYQYNESTNSYMPTGSQIDIHDSKSSYQIDMTTGIIK